jgi:aerobic-type carbon monoxide dehydrogenase small subunit (CoxS/CutS family)
MSTQHTITVEVNGVSRQYQVEARRLLSDFIRDDLGLTGTHVGCEHGICGACTILFNGEAARSCIMFAVQADGARIQTIEGLSQSGEIGRLQALFAEKHALQCGFCTPAMLITAYDLLRTHASPSDAEIREGMSAALCRCTGYDGIIKAVTQAAKEHAVAPPADVDRAHGHCGGKGHGA